MLEANLGESTTFQIDRSLSYTRLVDFAKNGPEALVNRNSGQSISMSIGSLTDDFLNENININDKYYIYDGEKPTASLGKLCNIIIDHYREVPSLEEVIEIVKKSGFWTNIKKEELFLSKFNIPEFWDYITIMITKSDKEIITSSMYEQAEDMAHLIKTHDHTKDLFSNNYKRIYQYYFEIVINKVFFRGQIDFVKIDHKKKTIEFIDFKTGSDPSINFSNIFINMRYFIQEAVYTKAYKHFCKTFNLRGYKLLPFKFIYISKSEMIPVSYIVTPKWHKAALHGVTPSTG